jgi:4-hydroxy 2-oxovalerate aldolase
MKIYDVTLRDGSHAVNHSLTYAQIENYSKQVDQTGADYVEVGHGIGLGASSLLIGEGLLPDIEMLKVARKELKHTKLAIHVVPGYGTREDIQGALDQGVDCVRVATHCTEADISSRHIEFLADKGVEVFSGLMLAHMASREEIVSQAKKLESYGAKAVTILDSAGHFTPNKVDELIRSLVDNLEIDVGFHAHNNMGLAVGNSFAALQAGASLIDVSINGFGAGAGNAPYEQVASAISLANLAPHIDIKKVLELAEQSKKVFNYTASNTIEDIVSGISGVVSVFSKPVSDAAHEYNVDVKAIFFELGRRGAVAGQEDLIIEVARYISETQG